MALKEFSRFLFISLGLHLLVSTASCLDDGEFSNLGSEVGVPPAINGEIVSHKSQGENGILRKPKLEESPADQSTSETTQETPLSSTDATSADKDNDDDGLNLGGKFFWNILKSLLPTHPKHESATEAGGTTTSETNAAQSELTDPVSKTHAEGADNKQDSKIIAPAEVPEAKSQATVQGIKTPEAPVVKTPISKATAPVIKTPEDAKIPISQKIVPDVKTPEVPEKKKPISEAMVPAIKAPADASDKKRPVVTDHVGEIETLHTLGQTSDKDAKASGKPIQLNVENKGAEHAKDTAKPTTGIKALESSANRDGMDEDWLHDDFFMQDDDIHGVISSLGGNAKEENRKSAASTPEKSSGVVKKPSADVTDIDVASHHAPNKEDSALKGTAVNSGDFEFPEHEDANNQDIISALIKPVKISPDLHGATESTHQHLEPMPIVFGGGFPNQEGAHISLPDNLKGSIIDSFPVDIGFGSDQSSGNAFDTPMHVQASDWFGDELPTQKLNITSVPLKHDDMIIITEPIQGRPTGFHDMQKPFAEMGPIRIGGSGTPTTENQLKPTALDGPFKIIGDLLGGISHQRHNFPEFSSGGSDGPIVPMATNPVPTIVDEPFKIMEELLGLDKEHNAPGFSDGDTITIDITDDSFGSQKAPNVFDFGAEPFKFVKPHISTYDTFQPGSKAKMFESAVDGPLMRLNFVPLGVTKLESEDDSIDSSLKRFLKNMWYWKNSFDTDAFSKPKPFQPHPMDFLGDQHHLDDNMQSITDIMFPFGDIMPLGPLHNDDVTGSGLPGLPNVKVDTYIIDTGKPEQPIASSPFGGLFDNVETEEPASSSSFSDLFDKIFPTMAVELIKGVIDGFSEIPETDQSAKVEDLAHLNGENKTEVPSTASSQHGENDVVEAVESKSMENDYHGFGYLTFVIALIALAVTCITCGLVVWYYKKFLKKRSASRENLFNGSAGDNDSIRKEKLAEIVVH